MPRYLPAFARVAETTISATSQDPAVTAVGYVRVSTVEQAAGGLSLHAQRAAITRACRQRELKLVKIYDDPGMSGAGTNRPGLSDALAFCARTESAVLVVAKLDRLVRSFSAYASLVDRSVREDWRLIALDTPETDTPQGEAMQAIAAIFAQLERRLIGQRTREALAVLRASGVQLGRPPGADEPTLALIYHLHNAEGWSATSIARHLEERSIPAPGGGRRWHTSTVTRTLGRQRDRISPTRRSPAAAE